MASEHPYQFADKQIEYLRQEVNAEFQNTQNLASFDELNVIRVKQDTSNLYERIEAYHRTLCERVADDAYETALLLAAEYGYEKPKKRLKRHYSAALVSALFLLYSPVTKYQFRNESERKRERLAESVLSSPNRQGVRDSYNTGARVWFNQAQQYIDMSADTGREAGFKDAGVKKVQWVTQKDGRVCSECEERDGMVFEIDNVPDKPHPRCRCYLIPVSSGNTAT